MAFKNEGWGATSASISGVVPRSYEYIDEEDNLANIQSPGYFNPRLYFLKNGDRIWVVAIDGSNEYEVTIEDKIVIISPIFIKNGSTGALKKIVEKSENFIAGIDETNTEFHCNDPEGYNVQCNALPIGNYPDGYTIWLVQNGILIANFEPNGSDPIYFKGKGVTLAAVTDGLYARIEIVKGSLGGEPAWFAYGDLEIEV